MNSGEEALRPAPGSSAYPLVSAGRFRDHVSIFLAGVNRMEKMGKISLPRGPMTCSLTLAEGEQSRSGSPSRNGVSELSNALATIFQLPHHRACLPGSHGKAP